MVEFLESMVTLVCLRQSTRVSFMGWLDTPSFVSGLNAWIVVFGIDLKRCHSGKGFSKPAGR